MLAPADFLFAMCQAGAEAALKAEFSRCWPDFRFAFSRPGFVTFKLPAGRRLARGFELQSTFARTSGFCWGRAAGSDDDHRARQVWQLSSQIVPDLLHVWQRDPGLPGDRGFEPGPTALAEQIGEGISAARPPEARSLELPCNCVARPGQLVLDCVVVQPDQWWIGFHEAACGPTCWPGGVPPLDRGADRVSRAGWKVAEALAWSELPVKPGDLCAEIGSAPGGGAQVLLERKLRVLAIDPAELDPRILAHPGLTHVRKRASDLKRREFRGVKWLFVDANVAPQTTLDTVEAIVTHREIRVRGMVLMLKLLDWQLAEQIPDFVRRVESWGYGGVRTRQLAFNRQEFCLTARRTRR